MRIYRVTLLMFRTLQDFPITRGLKPRGLVKRMDSEARYPGFLSSPTTYQLCELDKCHNFPWPLVPHL